MVLDDLLIFVAAKIHGRLSKCISQDRSIEARHAQLVQSAIWQAGKACMRRATRITSSPFTKYVMPQILGDHPYH